MNLSRVIGPAIGALIFAKLDAGPVFAINAGDVRVRGHRARVGAYTRYANAPGVAGGAPTALRACGSRAPIRSSATSCSRSSRSRSSRSRSSASCRSSRQYNLGMSKGVYALLYATFGLGAALGALTVGSMLAGRSKIALLRPGFVAFAVALAAFGLVRNVPAAFVGRRRGRLHVLPRHHVPVDDPAEAAARRGARPGDGAVDHALRRDGAARGARRRPVRQVVLDRGAARRGSMGAGARAVLECAPLREKGAPDD